MPELMFGNFGGNFREAQQQGFERGKRNKLAELYSQAMQAPEDQRQPLVAEMARRDPGFANATQQQFQGMHEKSVKAVTDGARLLANAPEQYRPALYARLLPQLRQYGLPDLPEQYDDTVAKAVTAISQMGSSEGTMAPRVVGDALVDPSGKVVYQAPHQNRYEFDSARGVWIPHPDNAQGQQMAPQGPPQQGQWAQPGASYQTPSGIARIDPGIDPAALEAVQADMQNNGQADSYTLPPQAAGGGLAAIPVAGIGPKQQETYRTLSPQEVTQAGLPQGTIAQMGPSGQLQIVNKPRDLPSNGQIIDNGDGTTTFIPAGKTSEGERNAAGFYQRMVEANKEMQRLTEAGYQPGNLRDFATVGTTLGNFAASNEGQQYHQAAMNWVRANLRKESGAAIGKDEAAQEIRNYFPQPGDTAETVQQKARNRETVERAMRTAAGGAMPPPSNSAPSAAPASTAEPKRPATSGDYSSLWK